MVKRSLTAVLLLIAVCGQGWAVLCDGNTQKRKDLTGTIPGTITCQGYSANPVMGLYDTDSHAYAACQALPGKIGSCSNDFGGTGCYGGVNRTKFDCYAGYKYVGSQPTFYWYCFPKPAAVLGTDYAVCPADTDGDGINDDIDPYPTDPAPFKYRVAMTQKDTGGVIRCIGLMLENGSIKFYGNPQAGQPWEYPIGQGWLDSSTWNGQFVNTLDYPATGSTAQSATVPGVYTNQTMATGATDTGNVTVQDQNTDIVNNTKIIADNQAKQQVALQEIRDGINSQTKILSDQLAKNQGAVVTAGSGGGGLTAAETQAAVQAGVDAALTDSNTTAGDFSGTPDGSGYTAAAALPTGSVPDNSVNTITKTLTDTKTSWSAFTGLFTGSHVTAGGGACNFTWSYFGKPVNFTMCNYRSQLETMGLVVFALAGVYACLIVLGRA